MKSATICGIAVIFTLRAPTAPPTPPTIVPTTLHTPLMSGTNAIHGVVIVGAILVAASDLGTVTTILGTIAVAFGASNVVGGFLVTDRMLEMFKRRPAERGDE